MPVTPVYQGKQAPESFAASVYLVGATPETGHASWRATALRLLDTADIDIVAFIPEPPPGEQWRQLDEASYRQLMKEEEEKFQMSDLYLVWRGDGPGITSNLHLGRVFDSGRAVLGAPEGAHKTRHPRYLAQKLHVPLAGSIAEMVKKAFELLGGGDKRSGGLRFVPPFISRKQEFKNWYRALLDAGNRLDYAELRWSLRVGLERKITFMWLLHPKIWIEKEQRYKDNEVVLFRPDISVTVLFRPAERLEDYRIVLIEEMRSAVAQATGRVYENPGGSSWKEGVDPRVCAVEEIGEETNLVDIDPARLVFIGKRQIAPTLSTFMAHVFMVALEDHEMQQVIDETGQPHGVIEDTEQAYTFHSTVGELLQDPLGRVAWPDLGMILVAVFRHYQERAKARA